MLLVRLMRQYWLLTPGPVNTTETVRNAAVEVDLCHREPEYGDLMTRVRRKLLDVAGVSPDKFRAALITGSGTSAMELGVSSIVRQGRKLLVVQNGVYGDRIDRMAELHGIERRELHTAWTERPDLAEIDAALSEDASIDAVALVHHETTTGLLNPVREVGALCRKHERLFFVDSVSGFGGEEIDLDDSGVDIMACTANKCLHGLPGCAFVIVSRRAEQHFAEVPARSLYFDITLYLREQERGTIPFTPCINATLALDKALDELVERGGIAGRIAEYKERSTFLRREMRALGLEIYLDEALLSNTITTFRLPKGVTYEALHGALKEDGFVIYAGQGRLHTEIFRVCNIGEMPMGAYRDFVASLARFLKTRAS